MKKLFAAIAALAVTSTMICPVFADNIVIDNWEFSYSGTGLDSIDKEKNHAELTEQYNYEGNYALNVKYNDLNSSIAVKNKMNKTLIAGTYEMSFYAIGSAFSSYTNVIIGETQYNIKDDFSASGKLTGADGKTNWKKYTKSINYSGADTDEICFVFSGDKKEWVIDCVSLTDGDNFEYIKNPSFESLSESSVSEYISEKYDPVNFMATPFSGGLAVTWRNPSTNNLKKMELYDITGGKKILLSNSFDNAPSTAENPVFNHYKISGLKNKSIYQYMLHISYRDGTEKEYFAYGIPSDTDVQYSPWDIRVQKPSAIGYSPMRVSLDANEKHTGDASIKITSNYKSGVSDVWVTIYQKISISAEKKYILSFWAKTKNNNATVTFYKDRNNPFLNKKKIGASTDWTEYKVNISNTSIESATVYFMIEGATEALWLDDISLMEVEDSIPIGENVFQDGGFENNYKPKSDAKVKGLSAEAGDESVKLSWKSADGADAIRIYEKMEEGFCSRGYIHNTATSIEIGNLLSDATYTFALACVDECGNEGEKEEVSAYVEVPDFKVYEPKLYIGKDEVNKITSKGTYTIKTKIRNNGIDESVPVCQLVALYKGDILKKLVSSEAVANKLEKTDISTEIKTDIEVTDTDISKYHFEVFIWNSKSGMIRLRDFVKFE